jgi:hypothetical protein
MQNDIYLSFLTTDPFWTAELKALTVKDASIEVPSNWWTRFEALGGPYWQEMFELDQDRSQPSIVSWKKKRNKLELYLEGGYISFDRAKCMVGLLHLAGCTQVQAIVYTDGCESLTDEDGVEHRLGDRFYIDAQGAVVSANYPEIDYEFYD